MFFHLAFGLLIFSRIKFNNKIIIVHKIKDNVCGETCINKNLLTSASKFTNLKIGSCKDHGYNHFIKSDNFTFPIVGELQINIYHISNNSTNNKTIT
tara:strand:- start:364 stop:654 length:291 start_codon:yes stop_codon:yes gene_type:complete